jgi:hypothetical protein
LRSWPRIWQSNGWNFPFSFIIDRF